MSEQIGCSIRLQLPAGLHPHKQAHAKRLFCYLVEGYGAEGHAEEEPRELSYEGTFDYGLTIKADALRAAVDRWGLSMQITENAEYGYPGTFELRTPDLTINLGFDGCCSAATSRALEDAFNASEGDKAAAFDLLHRWLTAHLPDLPTTNSEVAA